MAEQENTKKADKKKKDTKKGKSFDPKKYIDLTPEIGESSVDEGVEEVVASDIYALAVDGQYSDFIKSLPENLKLFGEDLYDDIREEAGLTEEQIEEVLSISQRRQRGRTMKRYAKRNARKRKISMRRKASNDKLKGRALKRARNIIKSRLAGQKKYADLPTPQKIQIDKRLQKVASSRIQSLAKRQLPKVRKKEMERIKKMRSGNESLDVSFENFLEELEHGCNDNEPVKSNDPTPKQIKRYHRIFNKEGSVKCDRRFKMYRKNENPYFGERFIDDAKDLMETVEDIAESIAEDYHSANIPAGYGDFARGDRVIFRSHSMDLGNDDARQGTVVGGDVTSLRVRDDEGKLYIVRHTDAQIVEDASLFTLDESFAFKFLDEASIVDQAIEAMYRHVLRGKSIGDVAWEVERLSRVNVGTKKLMKAYIDKYGDPDDVKCVNRADPAKLRRKYL